MSRFRFITRGAARRCPRCGEPDVFSSFFTLRPRCPNCSFDFEREEGYWVGAMIVNIGVTELVFAGLLIGVIVGTWPDVPWTWLLVAALAVNAILPIVFYPLSKTVWMGVDLFFNPPSASEEADAIAHEASRRDDPSERSEGTAP